MKVAFNETWFSIDKDMEIEYDLIGQRGEGQDKGWNVELRLNKGKVKAVDDENKPVIITNRIGAGHVVFNREPVEKYLQFIPGVFRNDKTYKIYRNLKAMAGIKDEVSIDHTSIEHTLYTYNDKRLMVIINHDRDKIPVEIKIPEEINIEKIVDLSDGKETSIAISDGSKTCMVEVDGKSGKFLLI